MRHKFFALTAISVLAFSSLGSTITDTKTAAAKRRQASRLVSVLPSSDGIAVFDSKRFLSDALPKILAANPQILGDITAKIGEVENRTGIDLRKFDQVAVGVSLKQVSAKETDYEPVIIAGGDINPGALMAAAKIAAKGGYREETVGGKTIGIFTPKAVVQKTPPPASSSKAPGTVDKMLNGFSKEVAVAALDAMTLVIGSPAKVKETILGSSHVSPELTSLLSIKETAVMSFAFRPPGGMAKMLPLENDQFGTNLDSIQFLSGSVDVAATGSTLLVAARTKRADQAQSLKEMLEGLQMLGKAVFGNSKRPDQQVYGRILKNTTFDLHGTDVVMNVTVPQSDIDFLVGAMK